MEARNLGYSMKNIPIPTKQSYLKSMMEKVEYFITRSRWKAYSFDRKEHSVNNMNFGFKSNFTRSQYEALSSFESDLYNMIRSINFKPLRNDLEKKLTKVINNINSSESLLIFAGKVTNLYEVTPEQYKTILTNNVTKTYQKAERSTQITIDREVKTISKTLQPEKRMERYAERTVFISLKYHQENFKHNTKCRLINPSKGEIGVVSKRFLEEINIKLNNHLCYNQWRNISTVMKWFKAIEYKKTCKFI